MTLASAETENYGRTHCGENSVVSRKQKMGRDSQAREPEGEGEKRE